jgi:hypothetical protein
MRLQPGFRFEKRKGRGWRLRVYKPTLVTWAQKRPTAVYEFTYEREDGMTRVISGGVGRGRFRRGKESDAQALFERRLSEQFGEAAFKKEAQIRKPVKEGGQGLAGFLDATCERIRTTNPELHQDNYELKKVRRI